MRANTGMYTVGHKKEPN